MNYALAETILITVLKSKESGMSCFEINVSELTLPEIENVKYKLMARGFRVLIYNERKENFLGIWF